MSEELAKQAYAHADERYEKQTDAGIQFAKQSFQSLLLLNGGACIAILGFLANTYSAKELGDKQRQLIESMVSSLTWFSLGAFATVLSTVIAFLSNRGFADSGLYRDRIVAAPYLVHNARSRRWERYAMCLLIVALIGALTSLGFFLAGLVSINNFV